MKFTNEELLLAAQVRSMASKIQEAELNKALEAWEAEQMSNTPGNANLISAIKAMEAQRQPFRKDWYAAHPVSEFGPIALTQLEKMADVIRNSRSV